MVSDIKMAHRNFRIGERVFVCDYENQNNFGFGKLVAVNYTPKKNVIYSASVATIVLENGKKINIMGDKVYKIAPRISKKIGEVVCYEHHTTIGNYPFYMPSNDENYYRVELGI